MIMADRGFTIKEDLIVQGATLEIPPSSSGLEQMTREKVKTAKKIVNARIHVERAIGRMKGFYILKNILPITLVPLIDDILVVCAGLCNLLPPLSFISLYWVGRRITKFIFYKQCTNAYYIYYLQLMTTSTV